MKTKQEFLTYLHNRGACPIGYDWVKYHRSNDAEDIWLDIPNLEWMAWLLQKHVLTPAQMKALCWHLVQTSLDYLGAEFVHEHKLNKPLRDKKSMTRVLANLKSLDIWVDSDEAYAIDVLMYVSQSRSLPKLESLRVIHLGLDFHYSDPELEQLYLDDIRHILSWDDFCKGI